MKIGASVKDMIMNDEEAEGGAVAAYNAGIKLAREFNDEATAELLVKILKMEEGHVEWAEKQRAQISQMGLEGYLSLQSEGAA
jgi:bacterioferritin (cytochrome b1)